MLKLLNIIQLARAFWLVLQSRFAKTTAKVTNRFGGQLSVAVQKYTL